MSGTLAGTVGVNNGLRYRGYYFDNESSLYYLNSRYYDPSTGRFVNADSLASQESVIGNNLFAYCLNNPVNMSDESGNLPFFAITAIVGAVFGAVVGGITAAANGGDVLAGVGIGAAAGALIGTGVGAAAGVALAGSITATTGMVVAGASGLATTVAAGGIGAGVSYVATNIQQVTSQVSSVVTNVTTNITTKAPTNPGVPFEAGKTGFQYGVDPNTLTPTKDLSSLDPQRVINAIKYAADHVITVGSTGRILDGHHRVLHAIITGRAIDIFVEPFK